MEFLTLLNDYNGWLDWITGRYEEDDLEMNEPKSFPCYVGEQTVDYIKETKDFCFEPIFFYAKELREMLDNLE